jgi:hypothetical protein
LRLLLGGCAPALLSFRWSPWDPGVRTGARSASEERPRSESTIGKLSLF